jgi:hypothetical protein
MRWEEKKKGCRVLTREEKLQNGRAGRMGEVGTPM